MWCIVADVNSTKPLVRAGGFFIGYVAVGNSVYMTYGAENIAECTARMEAMERWYLADGRDRKDHPLTGTYTGLYNLYRYHSTLGLGEPVEVPASTWR